MTVTKCMICDKNLGHTHGNRKTCEQCQKPKHKEPSDIWVMIKNRDLKELQRKARIQEQIDLLDDDSKEAVNRIFKVLLKGKGRVVN